MDKDTKPTPPWSGVAMLFFITGVWHLTVLIEFLLLGICFSFFLKISKLSDEYYRALWENREFKEIEEIIAMRESPKFEIFVTAASGMIVGLIFFGVKSLF